MDDALQPFSVPASEGNGAVNSVDLKGARPGILELHVISGGPVFLFDGDRKVEGARVSTSAETDEPDFKLAAVVGDHAELKLTSAPGELTVYSEEASIGYIRIRDKACG